MSYYSTDDGTDNPDSANKSPRTVDGREVPLGAPWSRARNKEDVEFLKKLWDELGRSCREDGSEENCQRAIKEWAGALWPRALVVKAENIPDALKRKARWLLWRFKNRSDGVTKVPYCVRTGGHASVTDPSTWAAFDVVWAAYETGVKGEGPKYDGIGFVFTGRDEVCGLDFDDVRNATTGSVDDCVHETLSKSPTYAEVSPGSAGVKAFGFGRLPGDGKGRNHLREDGKRIEAYDRGKYFAVTGHRLEGAPHDLKNCQGAVDHALGLMGEKTSICKDSRWADGEVWSNGFSDERVVELCEGFKNGDKFRRLYYDGDAAGYGQGHRNGVGAGASESDMALLRMLAFVVGPDPDQIKRIFYASALGQREKVLAREDNYLDPTIEKILNEMGDKDYYGQGRPQGSKDFEGIRGEASSSNSADGSAENKKAYGGIEGIEDFEEGRPEVVPFPIAVFPDALQTVVREVSNGLDIPLDLFSVSALTVAGTSIGSSCQINLKGAGLEMANLFVCIVAPSGSAKTPAMDAVVKRLKEVNGMRYKIWQAEREAAQGDESNGGRKVPPYQRTWTDDATVESYPAMLEANSKGFLIYPDELTSLVNSFNKYRGGKGSDRQFFMKLWRRQDLAGARADGREYLVQAPFVGILGSVPPAQVSQIVSSGTTGDGFFERFLFSFPEYRDPSKYEDLNLITTELTKAWDRMVDRLLGLEGPIELRLPCAAETRWGIGYNAHVDKYKGLSETMRSMWSKNRAQAARLIIILHALRWAAQQGQEPMIAEVAPETVDGAWRLIAYFEGAANRVYGIVSNDEDARKEQKIRETVQIHKWTSFSKNDLFQKVRKTLMFSRIKTLDAPLHRMVARGEYKRLEAKPTGKPGRPSEQYEVP